MLTFCKINVLLLILIAIGCGVDSDSDDDFSIGKDSGSGLTNEIVAIENDGVLVIVQHYNQHTTLDLLGIEGIFEIAVTNSNVKPKTVIVTINHDIQSTTKTFDTLPFSMYTAFEEAPVQVAFEVEVEIH
jgi:hypothetical protein